MFVFSVASTEGGVSVMAHFADAGEGVCHSTRALPGKVGWSVVAA